MPDINMQVFEEVKRNQLVSEVDIQTQVALDDYQMQLSDIVNPTQSQDNVVIDRHGEFLPHWNESLDFDTWIKMSMEVAGKRILMLRGNSSVSGASSIDDTFIFGDGFSGSSIDAAKWNPTGTWTVADGTAINAQSGSPLLVTNNEILSGYSDYIIESRGRAGHDYGGTSITSETLSTGVYTTGYDNRWIYTYQTSGGPLFKVDNVLKSNPGYDCVVNTWYRNKMVINPSGTHYSYLYSDAGSLLATASTTDDSSSSTGYLAIHARDGIVEIDTIFVRKYDATEPMWAADNIPQNIVTALKSLGRAG